MGMRSGFATAAGALLVAVGLLATACGGADVSGSTALQDTAPAELAAADLQTGERLHVAATTNIIADVVRNVGGDNIELTQLIPDGTDPHGFTPAPQDVRMLNDAHAVFLNGLGLEQPLMPVLENLDGSIPFVVVNQGVETIELGATEGEEHSDSHDAPSVDPHTWFSVPNVKVWTDNIAAALSVLDPAHAENYQAAAADYQAQLDELDRELRAQVESVSPETRKLVTDHVALGYLEKEYGFQHVGAILPSLSTLAAASAQEMATLQEAMKNEDVQAIFISTTVNPQTANQLAQDLGISVVPLYIGSLSDPDGSAPTYLDLMRYDMEQIVNALR